MANKIFNTNLDIKGDIKATSFIKTLGTSTQFLMADGNVNTFGTTAGTVAQGNDSRIINGQTAYGWDNHAGLYIPIGQKGAANGVATLDASGLIPTTQLPSYIDDVIEAADLTALNALPAGDKQTGKIYVALDTNKSYRWSGSAFIYITSGAVDSVAGKTGVVTLVKGDVGLGNVDNTSDSTKSVASAAKLTTARTIGGVSFDGTANINLPGVNTTGNQSTTGNAATATTLQTARTLTIGAKGKNFDGSANVEWSLAEIGAQAALTNPITGTATSGKVAFFNGTTTQTGDTNLFWDNTNKRLGIGTTPSQKLSVNGNITLVGTQATPHYIFANDVTDNSGLVIKAGSSAGVYSQIEVLSNWNGTANSGGKIAFHVGGTERLRINPGGKVGIGTTTPSEELDVNGNVKATSFKTSEGTPSQFLKADGSVDSNTYALATGTNATGTWGISITGNAATATNATNSTNSNILNRYDQRTLSPSLGASGGMQFGFTSWNNNSTSPYADFIHMRSYQDSTGGSDNLITFLKSGIGMRIWQQTYGSSTAYSSYKDVAFTDGSNSTGTWGISITGNAATATTTTGNAATATKLQTARTIGGVSFDGTANINLPGVNAAGNQSTTGNAATATTLQTARTLTIGAAGKNFDGSANVSWSLAEIGAMSTNHVANSISSTNINEWNAAHGWGSHSGLYLPLDISRPALDLDTVRTSGIKGGGSITNKPPGSSSYSPFMVLQSSTDRFVQLWFDSYGGGNNIYYRAGSDTTWNNWKSLWHSGNFDPATKSDTNHTHTFASLTSKPTTIAGYGITDAVNRTEYKNFGEIQFGTGADWTTTDFINYLTSIGFFNQSHSIARGSWSYAGNSNIVDVFGGIELAGTIVESFSNTTNKTIRITCPTTSTTPSAGRVFVYNDQSNGTYSPGWREEITTNSPSVTNWNAAYNDKINSASLTASTLTLNQQDGTTITASVPTFNQSTTGNAATATTLQTARTINGTSFNGSANITTANWGTGRTITIGSTGKTVDGSGNVSWTLAEIGAQAALTNPITGTAASGQVAFFNGTTTQTGDTNLFWDNTNKRLGIGTTTPSYKLDVNGNVRATQEITALDFIGTSDFNLKENIETYDEKPLNTEYRSFNFKNDDTPRIGLIAQELEQHHPEFVRTDMNGEKSISYIDLHSAEIAYLKKYCARLEEELNELKSKI